MPIHKNRILFENYFLPGDLEQQVAAFVDHYNHRRYHESLCNLIPPTSTSGAARYQAGRGRLK